MSQEVTIQIEPGAALRFPGVCANCGQPAPETMTVRQRNGRVTREIDIPVCVDCLGHASRTSAAEEQLTKISRLVAGVSFLSITILVLLFTSGAMPLWQRVLLVLVLGGAAALAAYRLVQPAIEKAALPEKQAVRDAVQIRSFSWRTTTLAFADEAFAERFRELNQSALIGVRSDV